MKTNKIKAILVSLAIVILLTIIKFIFYKISGSIAVYSEAWHSFSDIFTTSVVFFVLLRNYFKEKKKEKSKEETVEENESFLSSHPETVASIFIGLILLGVSISVFQTVFSHSIVVIKQPVFTGIIFLLLSLGSFFIFKFQEASAKQENSQALKADSLHNRADMLASLFTGFSLILYSVGLNFDKFAGFFLAIMLLSISIELLFNGMFVYFGKDEIQIHIYQAVFFLFSKKQRANSPIYKFYKFIVTTLNNFKFFHIFAKYSKKIVLFAFLISLIFYFSTIFYTVKPDQEAFYVLFGKIVGSKQNLKKPGIHLRFPWPFGTVIKFRTKRVYTLYIGNQTKKDEARLWSVEHGDTKKFISGDDNFMLPYIGINYKISNPFDYYYKQKNPDKLLRLTTNAIFSKIFANSNLYDAILYKKKEILKTALKDLKKELKKLDAGVEIVNLFIEDIHPPSTIAGSFESVVAAWQLKERTINNAQKYALTTIPVARSVALRQVLGAEAFSKRKELLAKGTAQNFLLKKEGFLSGKKILTTNMRLDAVVQTLQKRPVIIVDPKTKIPSNLIYMEQFMKRR